MISFKSLIINVICNKCVIPNYSHPSWHGKVCFNIWSSLMDDYHEFMHAHEIHIEEWQLYWSPNYVSITRGVVAPSGATKTPNINLINGSRNTNASEAIKTYGTIGGGGAKATISM
jgi:hypothetical protein